MKASSRYKKQPAFDPSELEDLIHSPAVGSGVSSHLIRAREGFPSLPFVDIPQSAGIEGGGATQTIGLETTGAPLTNVLATGSSLETRGLQTSGQPSIELIASHNLASQTTGLLPGTRLRPVVTNQGRTQTSGQRPPSVVVRYYGKPSVRPASTAQDGHSQIEEAIYRVLWARGVEVTESTRETQAGYMELVSLTNLSQASIKRGLKSLQGKLAIEVKETYRRELNAAKVYRVYSYRSILKRRDDAGLRYVIRNRGGVELTFEPMVSVAMVNEAPLVCEPMVTEVDFHRPLVSEPMVSNLSANIQTRGAMVCQTTGPMVYESPYPYSLIRKLRNNDVDDGQQAVEKEAVENLERRIRTERPLFDGAARIWRQSRELVPDCTVDEVCQAFSWKASELDRKRGLQNFNGALLEAWPAFFTRVLTDLMRKKNGDTQPQSNSNREEWRRRLNDPATDESERKLLRLWLGE